jgi:hypothetical protein
MRERWAICVRARCYTRQPGGATTYAWPARLPEAPQNRKSPCPHGDNGHLVWRQRDCQHTTAWCGGLCDGPDSRSFARRRCVIRTPPGPARKRNCGGCGSVSLTRLERACLVARTSSAPASQRTPRTRDPGCVRSRPGTHRERGRQSRSEAGSVLRGSCYASSGRNR